MAAIKFTKIAPNQPPHNSREKVQPKFAEVAFLATINFANYEWQITHGNHPYGRETLMVANLVRQPCSIGISPMAAMNVPNKKLIAIT